MRRTVGAILVGLGAFFIAVAPLVRFYVAHRLVAAPVDLYQRTTLRADNATYLDQAALQVRHGATVIASNTTRGDVRDSDDKIAVWDSFTSIQDPATKAQLDVQSQRSAFDRRTGKLFNVRGASVQNNPKVKQSGIALLWPIGVKKQTYQYFDITTRRAWPINYSGEGRIRGIKTYRFVQRIPPTVTETVQGGAPASLLGLTKTAAKAVPGYDPKTGNIAVDRVYQADVTVWVDPRTGAPLSQEQKVKQTLRTSDGVDRLTVADLDLKMTPASQKSLADYSGGQAFEIGLARSVIPLVALILGVVLLAVGIPLAAARRPRHRM